MWTNLTTVDDYFSEEREFLSATPVEYFNAKRKCLKYHYTNIDAVINILDSKQLWLTHYSGMNDLSEGEYLLNKLKDVLINYEEIHKLMTDNLYLVSFCFFGNLLSQWSRYGSINIGFDLEGLQWFIEDSRGQRDLDTSGTQFYECKYFGHNDKNYLSRLSDVKRYLINIDSIMNTADEKNIMKIQKTILDAGLLCFTIKHLGFREECESRIVSYLWNRQPCTNSKGRKYIKLEFCPERVKRVVVGPVINQKDKRSQEDNITRLEEFLSNSKDYRHVELVKSTIPYRTNL